MTGKKDFVFWGAMVLGCALLISMPFFSHSLVIGHDALFHLMRIEGIKDGLEGGQFPVRIYGYFFSDYGYPAGFFYPDLFFYLPALLRLAGSSVVFSYHAFGIFINIMTAMIAWWSFTQLFRGSIYMGAVTSMLYTGFLYRLVDMYSRCAMGEVLAMAFLPLALVSFWKLLHDSGTYWIGVVLGCTGVLQSHIISSLLLVGAMAVLAIVSFRCLFQRATAHAILKSGVFVCLLNVWFYAPFYSFYQQYDFSMKQVLLSVESLKNAAWSWEHIAWMQGLCGVLPLAILGVFAFLFWRKKAHRDLSNRDYFFPPMLLVGIVSLFLMSTSMPWDSLKDIPFFGKKLGVIQFGFRFMIYGAIAFSVCYAIAITGLARMYSWPQGVVILCCCIVAGTNFWLLSQKDALRIPDSHNITVSWAILHESDPLHERLLAVGKHPVPSGVLMSDVRFMEQGTVDTFYRDYLYSDIPEQAYLKKTVSWSSSVEDFVSLSKRKLQLLQTDDVQPHDCITGYSRKGTTLDFSCQTETPQIVLLPLFYYPGYEAVTATGEELEVSSGENHRLQVLVPAGFHEVTVRYVGRTAWRNAGILSLFGWMLFLGSIWHEQFGRGRKRFVNV